MRAFKLTGVRQSSIVDVPEPQISSDNDVLVRMDVVGVCGSDVHYFSTGRIGSQIVRHPFTVGHEGSGVVEAVGSAVQALQPGDRVALEPAMPCGVCDQCLSDRPHTCRKLKFLGCPGQAEGCLSERIVLPSGSCVRISDGMTLEDAVLSEPLAIGLHAVRLARSVVGKNVGILGCGPIGLCVSMAALQYGAGEVFATDPLDYRTAMARKLGAAWTGNPKQTDIVSEILSAEPLGLDVIFECCGHQEAADQAIRLLKPGGLLLLVGIPPTMERWSFPVDDLRRKEICVQNVRRQCDCVHEALELIDDDSVPAKQLVTHRFPFEETHAAFELVEAYRDGVVKAMIHFS